MSHSKRAQERRQRRSKQTKRERLLGAAQRYGDKGGKAKREEREANQKVLKAKFPELFGGA